MLFQIDYDKNLTSPSQFDLFLHLFAFYIVQSFTQLILIEGCLFLKFLYFFLFELETKDITISSFKLFARGSDFS